MTICHGSPCKYSFRIRMILINRRFSNENYQVNMSLHSNSPTWRRIHECPQPIKMFRVDIEKIYRILFYSLRYLDFVKLYITRYIFLLFFSNLRDTCKIFARNLPTWSRIHWCPQPIKMFRVDIDHMLYIRTFLNKFDRSLRGQVFLQSGMAVDSGGHLALDFQSYID